MNEWLVLAIAFLAVAIGWVLGRFPVMRLWHKLRYRTWRKSYMQGLHFLLNEEPDHAIEHFIESWPVNSANFDLHNALANMLRRKGEVDRAIAIHANLLQAKLAKQPLRQATMELAKDYITAGLLDRAERLLINVVNSSNDFEEQALELLQQVYQLEKEWQKAITIAEQLLPKKRVSFASKSIISGSKANVLAQYYCEIAQEALADDNFKRAGEAIENALRVDAQCARATLLKAELSYEMGQPNEAVAILDRLNEQDPSLLPEALPLLKQCLPYVNDLADKLQQWLNLYPSVAMLACWFEIAVESDTEKAYQELKSHIVRRPTLKALSLLLEVQQRLDINDDAAVQLLQPAIADTLSQKPDYKCQQCGFSGKQLHWNCPKCQSFDTIRRIRGSEGD